MKRLVLSLLLIVFALPQLAHADPLTISFQGTVITGSGVPLHTGEGIVYPGDPIQVSLDIHNLTLEQPYPEVPSYTQAWQKGGYSYTIGPRSVNDGLRYWEVQFYKQDTYDLIIFDSVDPWPYAIGYLSFYFKFPVGTLSDLSGLHDINWHSANASMAWETTGNIVTGSINTSSVVVTPEPATFLLIVPGLLGVAYLRRRRMQ